MRVRGRGQVRGRGRVQISGRGRGQVRGRGRGQIRGKYAGQSFKMDGEEYMTMREDDIIGIVEA